MSLRRYSRNSGVNTDQQSTRPPSYTSNLTAIFPNNPNIGRPAGSYGYSDMVGTWSASLPGVESAGSLDSMTMLSQTESSLTDTTSTIEASADIKPPGGPRYSMLECSPYHTSLAYPILSVYYRVYTEDVSIPSTNPIHSNDPSLGRIPTKLVTPPHTVINLKRCLLAVENIDGSVPTNLFITASSQEPMDDTSRVSILTFPGPGCTPNEPMALVAKVSGMDRSALEREKTSPKPLRPKSLLNGGGLYSRLPSIYKSRHDSGAHHEIQYRKRYVGFFPGLLINQLLQCITEYITRTAVRCHCTSLPALVTPPSDASSYNPSRLLTPPCP
jgi:hypothetical protein